MNHFRSDTRKKLFESQSCIQAARGVRRRVSQSWPRLIHGEASNTVSCRCPSRLRVCVLFGSGKRCPTTVSKHHRLYLINIHIYHNYCQLQSKLLFASEVRIEYQFIITSKLENISIKEANICPKSGYISSNVYCNVHYHSTKVLNIVHPT